jgi:hypothetical protein
MTVASLTLRSISPRFYESNEFKSAVAFPEPWLRRVLSSPHLRYPDAQLWRLLKSLRPEALIELAGCVQFETLEATLQGNIDVEILGLAEPLQRVVRIAFDDAMTRLSSVTGRRADLTTPRCDRL